jgi:uncharacterized protein YaaR (DUF327 family)
MRIRKVGTAAETAQENRKTSSVSRAIGSLFAAELSTRETEVDSYEQLVESLRREIDIIGDKLAEEPVLANFQKFRELLSQLVKRVSARAYNLEKIGGTPQNPRTFEIITVINAEADRLYNLIVQKQRDNLAITAKVIDIKGLVIDLIT